jgi:hypothetical protein
LLINQGVEKDRLIILNSDEKIFLHNIWYFDNALYLEKRYYENGNSGETAIE